MPGLPRFAYLIILSFSMQFLHPAPGQAQLSDGARAAILINNRYTVFPDLTYARAGDH